MVGAKRAFLNKANGIASEMLSDAIAYVVNARHLGGDAR